MRAARGIVVSHETVRQWARKFGQAFANRIRRRLPRAGDEWHLDEVAIKIAGVTHWLWRAVDQTGMVLDAPAQSRRDKRTAERLLRKLRKRQCRAPRVMVSDRLASYVAAKKDLMPGVEHRQHRGLCRPPRRSGRTSSAPIADKPAEAISFPVPHARTTPRLATKEPRSRLSPLTTRCLRRVPCCLRRVQGA
jgi:transposase-like protein